MRIEPRGRHVLEHSLQILRVLLAAGEDPPLLAWERGDKIGASKRGPSGLRNVIEYQQRTGGDPIRFDCATAFGHESVVHSRAAREESRQEIGHSHRSVSHYPSPCT